MPFTLADLALAWSWATTAAGGPPPLAYLVLALLPLPLVYRRVWS